MTSFKIDKSKLPLHKREELKRKEDEQLAKEVYDEFVATFQDTPSSKISKTFVRGEVVNANETISKGESRPRLYKPAPTLFKPHAEPPVNAARRAAEEKAKKIMEEAMKNRPQKLGSKKKEENKRTSNLEAFKEELRRTQEERAERRKLRQQLQEHLGMEKEPLDRIAPSLDNPYLGTYDTDPTTTNIFLSNLNPKMTEEDVCRVFGHYGPLASIKIMYPRTDDERVRGYHTGFIAFMTRKDAERAVAALKGKQIMNFEMKLSWGKGVPIPAHPIYVPPKMMELTLPPPPSGLPFNAQFRKEDRDAFKLPNFPLPGAPPLTDLEHREAWDKMIRNAVVKVVIPTERQLLCTIHRLVEFVVREGPMFEAMIMNREMNNPAYRFLFENHSPAHIYYRWKLHSILQGDSPSKWNTNEFRMFEGGSIWRPPIMNFYHMGLPPELYDDAEILSIGDDTKRTNKGESSPSSTDQRSLLPPQSNLPAQAAHQGKKGQLTDKQRAKVEEMLSNLTPEREKIGDAMIYFVEHADAAEELVDLICESIWSAESTIPRKIAKLYLLSDILSNCTAKVLNVSYFRKHIGARLEEIFNHIHGVYEKIEARLKAEQFKQRVMSCFRSWEESVVYTTDFLIRLQNIFLGLTMSQPEKNQHSQSSETELKSTVTKSKWDVMTDEDVDGVPMPSTEDKNGAKRLVDYDLDGVPLDEEEDRESVGSKDRNAKRARLDEADVDKRMFIKSKWEEVDPDYVELKAGSSSKWEKGERKNQDIFDDDIDGVPMDDASSSMFSTKRNSTTNVKPLEAMTENMRQQLREIEVKVMKFQDELESGAKKRSSGMTVNEEVGKYREKLMEKIQGSKKKDEKHKSSKSTISNSSSSKRNDDEKRSSDSRSRRESSSHTKHRSPSSSKKSSSKPSRKSSSRGSSSSSSKRKKKRH